MNLQSVQENEFSSIFGIPNNTQEPKPAESGFSGVGDENSIFKQKEEPKLESKSETPIVENLEEKVITENSEETSLFENSNKASKKQADFTDLKNYFQEKIKSNVFLPLDDERLETVQDFDDLINANFTYKLEQEKEKLTENWYSSKSPAWQVVAQYAEKVNHPSELIPLIQGVELIDNVLELDPTNNDDAEAIVRMALVSRNESPDIIEEQISTFKDNEKLSLMAEKYKPQLVKQEQARIQETLYQKEQEEIANLNMIRNIHLKAVEVLETPFLGKHKMRKEEKAKIYDMIASPDSQTGGYKIFSAIDNLYDKGDFNKLRAIALLLEDEKAYNNYAGFSTGSNVAENVLRKVKTASTGTTSGDNTNDEPTNTQPKLNRQALSNESGFGFFRQK